MPSTALCRWTIAALLLICLALTAHPAALRADDPIDWDKARALYQRSQRGDRLTAEESAYLDRAKAERAKGNGPAASRPQMEPKATTGLIPLADLADGKYKDRDGGLYGGGKNDPPETQLKLALAAGKNIQPLDAAGKPAADGRIALLSIGMSNTTQEYSRFQQLANADAAKSKSVVLVDGAQGGQAAAQWTNAQRGPTVWANADKRLQQAGVTPAQVLVVWIKQAEIQPAQYGEFPKHANVLQNNLAKIVQMAKERYPNLQIAYLSSRIYAGYATTQLNPEPYAYEGAFSIRDLITQQIQGDASLNADPAKGPVKAPVLLWGPYLWADGTKGRAAGDLVYTREDLGPDGTHPSDSGRQKVAEQLLKFLKSDSTAKDWFTGK